MALEYRIVKIEMHTTQNIEPFHFPHLARWSGLFLPFPSKLRFPLHARAHHPLAKQKSAAFLPFKGSLSTRTGHPARSALSTR